MACCAACCLGSVIFQFTFTSLSLTPVDTVPRGTSAALQRASSERCVSTSRFQATAVLRARDRLLLVPWTLCSLRANELSANIVGIFIRGQYILDYSTFILQPFLQQTGLLLGLFLYNEQYDRRDSVSQRWCGPLFPSAAGGVRFTRVIIVETTILGRNEVRISTIISISPFVREARMTRYVCLWAASCVLFPAGPKRVGSKRVREKLFG